MISFLDGFVRSLNMLVGLGGLACVNTPVKDERNEQWHKQVNRQRNDDDVEKRMTDVCSKMIHIFTNISFTATKLHSAFFLYVYSIYYHNILVSLAVTYLVCSSRSIFGIRLR